MATTGARFLVIRFWFGERIVSPFLHEPRDERRSPVFRNRFLPKFIDLAATFTIIAALASAALGVPKYRVLHNFGLGDDGVLPWNSLVLDGEGNVYGTTSAGGTNGYGIVFELTPGPDATWGETVLYSFPAFSGDGERPTGLVLDANGNLYGTTQNGGAYRDAGIAFELTRGSWIETVLYNFCSKSGCSDGGEPQASPIWDSAGNLYGTDGAVFELSPGSEGWTETLLHTFSYQNDGGGLASTGVTMDANGNLYGTSLAGGSNHTCGGGCGTAWELHRMSDAKWKEHILHEFGNDDMSSPGGPLVLDRAGNLYGIAQQGFNGGGAIYRLKPYGHHGNWWATILYSLTGGEDGDFPTGSLVMDGAGNLYGTAGYGGDLSCDAPYGCGVVYELAKAGGKWKYTVLHRFTGSDGAIPDAQLVFDSKGNLYGVTEAGGASGNGVAFELTP
jgi:uncharacterized repeat protein (TIGR03803 family)